MASELKPCPFCGGEAEWGHHDCHNGEYHRCTQCGVEMPGDEAAWNRRALSAQQPEAVPFGHYFRDMEGRQHFHTGANPPTFAQAEITPLFPHAQPQGAVSDRVMFVYTYACMACRFTAEFVCSDLVPLFRCQCGGSFRRQGSEPIAALRPDAES